MSREYCMFVLEGGSGTTPYGTPVAPAASANIWTTAATTGIPSTASGANNYAGFYARLDGGDSFTMRPRPVPVTVPYGGGFAIPAFTVTDKQMLEGTYKTKLYAGAFTQMLLMLSCQQVNSLGYVALNGISTGWQYGPAAGSAGNQCGNLPSVSIFHAIQRSDGTYKHRLYYGVRVKILEIHTLRKQHDWGPDAPVDRCLCCWQSVLLPELHGSDSANAGYDSRGSSNIWKWCDGEHLDGPHDEQLSRQSLALPRHLQHGW